MISAMDKEVQSVKKQKEDACNQTYWGDRFSEDTQLSAHLCMCLDSNMLNILYTVSNSNFRAMCEQ